MKGLLIQTWALLLTATVRIVCSQPKRIPIGAFFDNLNPTSVSMQSVFKFQLERHNQQTSSVFKLDMYEKSLDVSDTFQLTRAECSTMMSGIFVLLGVTDSQTFSTTESFSETFHMPFVTPSFPKPQRIFADRHHGGIWTMDGSSNFTIHVRPHYYKAVVALIRHLKWTIFYYVYDVNAGLYQLEQLYMAMEHVGSPVNIYVVPISDVRDCYATLRKIDAQHHLNDKHILLDFSTNDALQSVLKQILQLGMHRSGYNYILGGLAVDDLDLASFRYGGVNITGFRVSNQISSVQREMQRDWAKFNPNIWRDSGMKMSLDSALTMDAVQVVIQGLKSLLDENSSILHNALRHGHVYNGETRGIHCSTPVARWSYGRKIMEHLRKVSMIGMTGLVAFDEHGFRKNFNLDVVSLTFENLPTKIGTWNDSHGLLIIRENLDSNRIQENNITYIVTTVIEPPYLMEKKKKFDDGKALTGNDRYDGFCADLARKIAEVCRFNYILRIVPDGSYGRLQEDGSWNGMIGNLTKSEADMAIAPLTISSARERVVDFSKPFMKLGISIMIKKPEKQKPGVFSFMDPLSPWIWGCIIISYLGVSLTLFLVSRFSPYEWQMDEGENGQAACTNDFTLLNSLWFSLGAFMQQGCGMSPRSLSGRLAGSSWWFFTLIIISTYTANLAAFLTVERMLTPINSAEDLVKQSEIRFGTLATGSTRDFFANSNISVFNEMWQIMKSVRPSVFVNSTRDGVMRVRTSKGKYAFLLESTMNDYHNQKKPCNTIKVGNNLDSKGYGVATPINHPLKIPVGLAVLSLRETGELAKLHKKWWYDKGECPVESDSKGGSSSQSALTLSNVAGIFYILIGGLGFSMVVSLFEFLSKTCAEARRQKKSFMDFVRSRSAQSSMKVSIDGSLENGLNQSQSCSTPIQIIPASRSGAISLV